MRSRDALPIVLLLALPAACRCGDEVEGETDSDGTETTTIDPGDAAVIGCEGAAWARVDSDGPLYTGLLRTPQGELLVSASRGQGAVVRWSADAERVSTVTGSGPDGSVIVLGGVDKDGRYAIAHAANLGQTCTWDEFDEETCEIEWERTLRFYDANDALLWTRPGDAVVGVREDGEVAGVDGDSLVVIDAAGELIASKSLGERPLVAIAPEGGYFATDANHSSVARLDRDLLPLWDVPDLGALDRFASAPDGGLVIGGHTTSGPRLHRVSADGDVLWTLDTGVLAGSDNGLVHEPPYDYVGLLGLGVGPDGAIAASGLGWLGRFTADGEVAWTLHCEGLDRVAGATVADDGAIVIAGNDYVASFAAAPAPEQPAFCGNQRVDDGEACDLGLDNGYDLTCSATCETGYCGNGIVEPGEGCDEGLANSDGGACTSSCQPATCGDGVVHVGHEACDGGPNCSPTCHFEPPTSPCADSTVCAYVDWSRGFSGSAWFGHAAVAADDAPLVAADFVWDLDLGGLPGEGVFVSQQPTFAIAELDGVGATTSSFAATTTSGAELLSLAPAPGGDLVVAGRFDGGLDFGGPPINASSELDLFVARMTADGEQLWSAALGGGSSEERPRIAAAVAANGDVALAGSFVGTLDLGGGGLVSGGARDMFVARLGPDGEHLLSARFGEADDQEATGVTVDPSGALIVTASHRGTVDLGGGPLIAPEGEEARLLARFDAAGEHLWSRTIAGAGPLAFQHQLGSDGAGAIYYGADFAGELDLGGGPLTATGVDTVVAKFATDTGALVWAASFGGAGDQYCDGLVVNADGEVAILTSGGGELDFGGGPLAEERTHAVARLGPDGQHRWSLAVPRPDFTSATYIGGFAVDSTGAVIVAGQYSGALAFGGKAFVTGNIEERRPFVARLVAP